MTETEIQDDHPRASAAGGVGSRNLATESSDPGELHALLGRARERLSFYEGFDRVIAENVRRSGELMLETLTIREHAAANAGLGGQGNRERLIARLVELSSGVDAAKAQIDALSIMIDELRASIEEADVASCPSATPVSRATAVGPPPPVSPPTSVAAADRPVSAATTDSAATPAFPATSVAAPATPVSPPTSVAAADRPVSPATTDSAATPVSPPTSVAAADRPVSPGTTDSAAATSKPRADGDWANPRVIDVIVHRVARAAIALSLQRHMGDLDTVVGVEAREFAEGVLRMQVTARRPLDRADFAGWTECGPITVLQIRSNAIELEIG